MRHQKNTIRIISFLALLLIGIIGCLALSFPLEIEPFATAPIWAELPFVALTWGGGCELSGIKQGFVIPLEDIETFAIPVASPSSGEEKITIVGSHTLASEKYWTKMYSTQGKGTMNFNIEGGRDFEKFTIGGSLFYPSTKKEALAMCAVLLNRDVIVLVEDNSSEEHFFQIGTEKIPARLKPSGDWGTELNGEKGITFELETFNCCPPYIYEGVIPLSVSEIYS